MSRSTAVREEHQERAGRISGPALWRCEQLQPASAIGWQETNARKATLKAVGLSEIWQQCRCCLRAGGGQEELAWCISGGRVEGDSAIIAALSLHSGEGRRPLQPI